MQGSYNGNPASALGPALLDKIRQHADKFKRAAHDRATARFKGKSMSREELDKIKADRAPARDKVDKQYQRHRDNPNTISLHDPANSTRRDAARNPYNSQDRHTGTAVAGGLPLTRHLQWDQKRLRNFGKGIKEILEKADTSKADGGTILDGHLANRLLKMGQALESAVVNIAHLGDSGLDDGDWNNLTSDIYWLDAELGELYDGVFGFINEDVRDHDNEGLFVDPVPTTALATRTRASGIPPPSRNTKPKAMVRIKKPTAPVRRPTFRTPPPPKSRSGGDKPTYSDVLRANSRLLVTQLDAEEKEELHSVATDDLESKDSDSDGSDESYPNF